MTRDSNSYCAIFGRSNYYLWLLLTLIGICVTGDLGIAKSHHSYQRIISLYSAHTENLHSLGATAQLVGVTQSDATLAESGALYYGSIVAEKK